LSLVEGELAFWGCEASIDCENGEKGDGRHAEHEEVRDGEESINLSLHFLHFLLLFVFLLPFIEHCDPKEKLHE